MTFRPRNTSCIFALVALLAMTTAAAQEQAQSAPELQDYAPDTVVATIDGEPLTLEELLFRFGSLSDRGRQAYGSSGDGLARYLDDVVAGLAVVREAEKLGLAEGELARRLVDMRREDALRDLYARATVLAEIDDTTLRARYDGHRERFHVPLRVRVSHILIKITADGGADQGALNRAQALRFEIAGGADFAEVARRSSDDLTASRGGDLGWVTHGVLAEELEKAAFALAPGEVSKVVRSKLGYHIAHVTGRRESGLLPFETVRELLLQELISERRQDLAAQANSKRQELLSSHEVEVFPDRLPW